MTESKIETSTYSTTKVEQRSSPVAFDSANRRLSQSNMNLSQDLCNENYYSSLAHLDTSQQSLSVTAIDQSVNQTIATDISQYPINQDPNPELIQRHNDGRITYKQDVAIRYLQPPTPPPPGPIIVREIRAPLLPEAPPVVIKQRAPAPPTPPPVVIRERPPLPPPIEPPRIVNKYLPAPPPLPRKVIIERDAPLPQKPQPVIIEKWLPYQASPERRVVVEHAAPLPPRPLIKNTIITHDAPHVDVVKNIHNLGVVRVDPQIYIAQYGSQLASNEYVLNTMQRFGIGSNYALMYEKHPVNRSFNTQQSLTYEQTNTSNMYSSQSESHYDSMLNHVGPAMLPNGDPCYPLGNPLGPPMSPSAIRRNSNVSPVGSPISPVGNPFNPVINHVGSPMLPGGNQNVGSSFYGLYERETSHQEAMAY